MSLDTFEQLDLTNRLGQPVTLGVKFRPGSRRDTLFVRASQQQAICFFGQHEEKFMFQLLATLDSVPGLLYLFEVRGPAAAPDICCCRVTSMGGSTLAPCSLLSGM